MFEIRQRGSTVGREVLGGATIFMSTSYISYAFGKLVTGRVKECPIVVYVFAVLFVVQYLVKP